MDKWNDIQKANALHVFCKSNGDIVACRDALKEQARQTGTEAPPLQTLKKWEKDYKWAVWHLEVMHALQADAAKAAIGDMRESLAMLVAVKQRVMDNILGKQDPKTGEWIVRPIAANSLETCANAFVRLVGKEQDVRKLVGADKGSDNPVAKMLEDEITGADSKS